MTKLTWEELQADTAQLIAQLKATRAATTDPAERERCGRLISQLRDGLPLAQAPLVGAQHLSNQLEKSHARRLVGRDGLTLAEVVCGVAKGGEPADMWPLMLEALADWGDCEHVELETDDKGQPLYTFHVHREGKETLDKQLTYRNFKDLLRRK